MSTEVMAFRRIVAPQHLNSADTLFGGTLMAWIDEACATYAMCQMQNRRVVTLKIGEVLFKVPVKQGDFLEFFCSTARVGRTSLVIDCTVKTKKIEPHDDEEEIVATCQAVFVSINDLGVPMKFTLRGSQDGA